MAQSTQSVRERERTPGGQVGIARGGFHYAPLEGPQGGAQEKGEGIRGKERDRERWTVQNSDHEMQPDPRQNVHTQKNIFLTHFVFVCCGQ